MTEDDANKILDDFCRKLGEHFDSVQIMVSDTDTNGTRSFRRGIGNWYARQGMAHEFIQQNISADTAKYIAQEIKE